MTDPPVPLRWRLSDDTGGQLPLIDGMGFVPGVRELAGLEFLHVNARRLINTLPAGVRLPFRHTINAYRGCSHACTYCFARPTHEYLNLDGGRDFERRIVVKVNAVERLRAELRSPRWDGDGIAMGTNTDPYQPCEGHYRLTRGIIGVLSEARNPFSILTKSTLILRDLDVLKAASERTAVEVALSIGTLDRDIWRATEPSTPDPARRVEAVAKLVDAGITCDVLVAPILPGLSDDDAGLRRVVEACVEAGARRIIPIPLHLRRGVRQHFLGPLARTHSDRVRDFELRYAGRGDLSPAEQGEIVSRVRRILRELRPDGAIAPISHPGRRMANRRPVPAPRQVSDQLDLLSA